jgi:flagellar biosynthesis/type III secretory pathway chaperone
MSSAYDQFARKAVISKSLPLETTIAQALDTLESTLQEENMLFESGKAVDHTAFIDRKNQILRELMILQRTFEDPSVLAPLAERLSNLKALIVRNKDLLTANITALGEVAKIMKKTMLDGEADGTYSKHAERDS